MAVHLFFLILALVSMLFDGWKIVNMAAPIPGIESAVVMRFLVAARFSGVFFLFASALFTTEFVVQRHGVLALIILGVAGLIAWNIPVDTFSLSRNGMFRVGLGRSVQAVIVVFIAIAILTYLQAGIRAQDERIVVSTLGVAALTVGHEILFQGSSIPTLIVGSAIMIFGGIVYGARNYRDEILD